MTTEEIRSESLAVIKQRIAVLTGRSATYEATISHAQNALEPIILELKELETRKAQLQDELERAATKCELRPGIGLCDSCSLPKWPQEYDGYGSMICADCRQKEHANPQLETK